MNRQFAFPFAALALAVALGAFGTHALGPRLSEHYLGVYKTGNLYHFIHGLGWILGLFFLIRIRSTRIRWYNTLVALGIILFSGSLYILALNEYLNAPGLKILGAITPLGGLAFIASWILLSYEAWRSVD